MNLIIKGNSQWHKHSSTFVRETHTGLVWWGKDEWITT